MNAMGVALQAAAEPHPIGSMAGPLRAFIARRVRPDQVEDVLQDALLKVHEHSAQLRDVSRFGAWVYRIGRSAIADHYRGEQRSAETPTADLDPEAHEPEGEAEDAFRQAMAGWLSDAIEALPEPYADALRRVEIGGQSQAQAARELGLAPSAMRSRVQRGRAQLRNHLSHACELHFDARKRLTSCTPRQSCCAE